MKRLLLALTLAGSRLFRGLSDSLARRAMRKLSMAERGRQAVAQQEGETDRRSELEDLKREVLSGVMDMGETVAREVMVPRTDMVCFEAGMSLNEVLAATAEAEHSRIPVYEETVDNVIGVLYSKELLQVWLSPPQKFDLRKIVRPAFFIPETKPLAALLREFQGNRVHMAIVVDEYGGTAGLVTLEDILEELIGEIEDEYDEIEEQVTRLENGDLLVDARADIEEVEELLGITIEKEDFESLGGLAINVLGHLPGKGENFEFRGYRFCIEKATDRKILKIRISRGGDGDKDLPR